METMNKLCHRFNRKYPEMFAELKDFGISVPGLYRVDICRKGYRPTKLYFSSCKEFSEYVREFENRFALIV